MPTDVFRKRAPRYTLERSRGHAASFLLGRATEPSAMSHSISAGRATTSRVPGLRATLRIAAKPR